MFPSPDRKRDNQKTLRRSVALEGIGLHSGKEAKIIVRPAPPNAGLFFMREGKKVPAIIAGVKGTQRGTFLDGIAVVEHLLSAARGLGIDNLEIETAGPELPALDGSSLPYVEAFERAGLEEQKEPRNYLALSAPLKIEEGMSSIEALPYHGFRVHFMVEFEGIGRQSFLFDAEKQNYKAEIAPARTFGYQEEYEKLQEKGRAFGASFTNALVLCKNGYVNQPRFTDEVVRHKILDLMGDLTLLGRPLHAEIFAVRSGHKLNIALARRILKNDRAGH